MEEAGRHARELLAWQAERTEMRRREHREREQREREQREREEAAARSAQETLATAAAVQRLNLGGGGDAGAGMNPLNFQGRIG